MTTARKPSPVDDPWMSLVAASQFLGMSRLKVTRYALAGELAHQTVGGRLFIDRDSAEALRDKLATAVA